MTLHLAHLVEDRQTNPLVAGLNLAPVLLFISLVEFKNVFWVKCYRF